MVKPLASGNEPSALADNIVVLDFETTGLSPDNGDRAIEIGAVRIRNGVIVEEFQQLMNPGRQVNTFIADYTGINNHMLANALPCAEVMSQFCEFLGEDNLLAHNASFDQRFLDNELKLIDHHYSGEFTCSLLIARRLLTEAKSHSLGNLVKHCQLAGDGQFHRALFDAQMTAKLWLVMLDKIKVDYGIEQITFSLMQQISCTPKKSVAKLLQNYHVQQCQY
ncbi:PolC-type DNA polymerase III [Psychrobium sp. 1_MG-2023]|uniref:3'-5' exonuclease n=1 Tax=Psychrobium sp. 1_MG-2023 TaxID=3062624 RepID=UPI000C34A54A|nr:3'-5' exonuclease [Psychrobium sp. 1_MG-2023]MDP2559770.1 3'-5' exonuclease [Psychrobium sp. 1_MG-2023]PKF59122.1 DNA polymerase III subunit epsilon [Alteromonadales bacterium alter-6D02]